MNDIRNLGQEVQAEILKTARKGQDAVVGAIRSWTETVRSITPPLKDLNLPFADRLPFANRLPRPEELAGNAYEFAQKLLASQRKFAEDVLRAAAPLLPGTGDAGKKSEPAERSEADKKNSPAERKNGSAAK
jgi:hypothetical protein